MIRLGERLAQERRRKGLSVDEVSKGTRIRPQFIIALEKGDYKKLPSSAYIRGFIKNYAQFLGLSAKETLALFRREFNEREFLGVLPDSFTNPKNRAFAGLRLNQVTIYIVVIVILIIGFVFFQYKAAFFGPNLTVNNPLESAVVHTTQLTVSGKTDPNVTVEVNEQAAAVSTDGSFKKDVVILAGTSEIDIKAVNNFGKEALVIRHIKVILKP
jgi:cytoskeletal protein RodZ